MQLLIVQSKIESLEMEFRTRLRDPGIHEYMCSFASYKCNLFEVYVL